ncbi:hypothetical protein OUZ56_017150 [Daphnia magna]|uniref:Uncharacterized protein n=1 Tax=Daphnia magna TaxID=35525 RepID=A0ABR0AS91_9CRUS|nr:hypothetical protein OUZ56_017150 [Daphnia magna]
MLTYSDGALVRFVDATFDNRRIRYSRLYSSGRAFFLDVLAEVKRTDAQLNFSPPLSTVWSGDFPTTSIPDIYHPTPHKSESSMKLSKLRRTTASPRVKRGTTFWYRSTPIIWDQAIFTCCGSFPIASLPFLSM